MGISSPTISLNRHLEESQVLSWAIKLYKGHEKIQSLPPHNPSPLKKNMEIQGKQTGLKARHTRPVLKILDCYHPNTFFGSGYLQEGGAQKKAPMEIHQLPGELGAEHWSTHEITWSQRTCLKSCQSQRIIWALSNHIINLPSQSLTARPWKVTET